MVQQPTAGAAPRRTPLYGRHVALGARMAEFAGFWMPIHYRAGQVAEHRAVRKSAGLFDVSHMGRFEFAGAGAAEVLDLLTPSPISRLETGRALYTALTTEEGTFVDDVLVYRLSDERFLMVVNAANVEKDRRWIEQHGSEFAVRFQDRSDEGALLALQGPASRAILARIAQGFDPERLRYYRVAEGSVAGRAAVVSRTGYTGEIGFEIFVGRDDAEDVWEALLEAGRPEGIEPAGLGARDTLRLEAGLPLYGHEIDETIDVLEAGLEFIVDWNKPRFIGKERLEAVRRSGPRRRRVGFVVEGRGIARAGYPMRHGGKVAGRVTSGTWAPTLERAIGMGYLPTGASEPGTPIEVDIRNRAVPAVVVALPFYRRPRRPGVARA